MVCATLDPPGTMKVIVFGGHEWGRRFSVADDIRTFADREREHGGVDWWEEDVVDQLPESLLRVESWEGVVEWVEANVHGPTTG